MVLMPSGVAIALDVTAGDAVRVAVAVFVPEPPPHALSSPAIVIEMAVSESARGRPFIDRSVGVVSSGRQARLRAHRPAARMPQRRVRVRPEGGWLSW